MFMLFLCHQEVSCVSSVCHARASKEVSKGVFVKKVFAYCDEKRSGSFVWGEKSYIRKVLELLYERCNGRKYELASVTANVLYGTSYFKHLESEDDTSMYRPRGILQICGKENYQKISSISEYDYVDSPDTLSRRDVMQAWTSVLFWMNISRGCEEIDMDRCLKILNPVSYQIVSNPEKYSKKQVSEARREILQRISVYEDIMKVLCLPSGDGNGLGACNPSCLHHVQH